MKFLEGFGICDPKKDMKLYCDSKAACEIAANLVHYDRTKHVEVNRSLTRREAR